MKWRKRILMSVLALIVMASGYSVYETWMFEQQLAADAERLVSEMKSDIKIGENGKPTHDVISVIIASREFGYWGEPVGKISIYLRSNQAKEQKHAAEQEKEKDDKKDSHVTGIYTGIDYFYDKHNTGWVNTESAQCSSGECQVLGEKAFQKAGL